MPKETFVIHPDYSTYQDELYKIIQQFDSSGSMLVDGERNTLKTFDVGPLTVNVKRFKKPNALQSMVYGYFRKGKARRSYEYANRLISAGIGTPKPIAYLERFGLGLKESFYLSEQLDFDFEFRMLNHNPEYPQRDEILKAFAAFTFKLHENQINFLDHSPGNTLIRKSTGGEYDFFLIDLNRMRFETLDLKGRMKNFRRMWLSKRMIDQMAPVYAELYDSDTAETHRLMTYFSRRFQKKVNSKKVRRRKRR